MADNIIEYQERWRCHVYRIPDCISGNGKEFSTALLEEGSYNRYTIDLAE
jgi:hypothetical protein